MYLDKLNAEWSAFLSSRGIRLPLVITNTAKLKGLEGMYMLEFSVEQTRFHFYHILGESGYDLRRLDEAYVPIGFDQVFDRSTVPAEGIADAIKEFMFIHYQHMQTSVDASQGLEKAKAYIHNVRWASMFPPGGKC